MGEGSPVNQSSLLGKFLPLKGKEAGGDYEIHDSHKIWNRKYTEHYETGIVIHVTSGNVQHANLNLSEVHATANVLTMHLDLTPLNVHIAQKIGALDVHIAPSGKHGHWNVGGGGHHTLVGEIHQEAQAVRITSTRAPLGFAALRADVSHAPEQPGNMTLKAAAAMTIQAGSSIELEASRDGNNNNASLSLSGTDGTARLFSKNSTIVSGDTKTLVLGGDSTILLKQSSLELQSGTTTVSLSPGKLETNGTDTKLNGRVTLGNPAVSGIVTKEIPSRLEPARVANVEQQIAAAMARLRAANIH